MVSFDEKRHRILPRVSEYRTDTGVIGHLQLREHRYLHGCCVNGGEKNILCSLEIRRDARLVIGQRIAAVIVVAGDRCGDIDVELGRGVCLRRRRCCRGRRIAGRAVRLLSLSLWLQRAGDRHSKHTCGRQTGKPSDQRGHDGAKTEGAVGPGDDVATISETDVVVFALLIRRDRPPLREEGGSFSTPQRQKVQTDGLERQARAGRCAPAILA